jgi:hypothetical protein
MSKPKAAAKNMERYRERLRAQGLRPVQLWVPDTRSPRFVKELRRQALLVARNERKRSSERDAMDALLESQDDTGWTR